MPSVIQLTYFGVFFYLGHWYIRETDPTPQKDEKTEKFETLHCTSAKSILEGTLGVTERQKDRKTER